MLQFLLFRSTLIFLSAALTFLTVACGREKENLATQNQQKLVRSQPDAKKSSSKVNSKVDSKLNPSSSATQNSADSQSNLSSDAILEKETKLSYLKQAQGLAQDASDSSYTAVSRDDWQIVVAQYQNAIALLKKVQQQSVDYTMAQITIAEYQDQMKDAIEQARLFQPGNVVASPSKEAISEITEFSLPELIIESKQTSLLNAPKENYPEEQQQLSAGEITSSPARVDPQVLSEKVLTQEPQTQESQTQESHTQETYLDLDNHRGIFVQQELEDKKEPVVFTAPIKRRVGGTPVIEVNFNGNRQFEMIVDTGASGTVITQNMAKSLGIKAVGKAQANTASAKAVEFPIGYVDSMEAAGVEVNQVAVAIAGKELEVGLLGHDFFGNYDLTIKRDVVELRPQSQSQLNSSVSSSKIQSTAPTFSKQPQTEESP